MSKRWSMRTGINSTEVAREWRFKYPELVIERIQRVGIHPSGRKIYHVFYHERKSSSKQYKIIKRANEIEISVDSGLETVSVVEGPRTLSKPVAPKKARDIFLSIIFGLGLACGMVFLLEYMDDSIKSAI